MKFVKQFDARNLVLCRAESAHDGSQPAQQHVQRASRDERGTAAEHGNGSDGRVAAAAEQLARNDEQERRAAEDVPEPHGTPNAPGPEDGRGWWWATAPQKVPRQQRRNHQQASTIGHVSSEVFEGRSCVGRGRSSSHLMKLEFRIPSLTVFTWFSRDYTFCLCASNHLERTYSVPFIGVCRTFS